ncbi:error-prone DNA polymerase [Psychrobium sp. MM17-31]|uniref:error-prone DNA polymerase n=1 Tax=Psychrobium sp. MM17-31 TaxID=2917758 RepID=UPI001EF4C64E|nr:error-prone DNA polymerase [Psychrobium sp. MM17-31]MCG7531641.1 error-prone DNA polymerase [Psychrobium sp. MM17-31]
MRYSELFCQSNFSFLTGASQPQELVTQAAFYGYDAIAITDECSVAGVVRAYSEIKDNNLNIKLIVGALFKLDDLTVVILCPNRKAYGELCRIITNSRRRAIKGHYQLSTWDLMSLKQAFVLFIPSGKPNSDEQWLIWLNKYHQGRLYIGLRTYLTMGESHYHRHCQGLAKTHHLDIVACGGVLMHSRQRLALQHTLTAIKHGCNVKSLGASALSNSEYALRPVHQLSKLFREEYLINAAMLAKRCQFDLSQLRYEYPSEVLPQEHTPDSYLRLLVERGIKRRFPEGITDETRATIEKELALISEQSYQYFFLTVYDVVQFAKNKGILYQGRGSAANSIVCYCLEITAVDPRQISVLFERFISKERNEPPDIDVDFEHQRREEVFQYIYQKYGRKRAALAATVITYRLKSAIRDVGKALGLCETQLDYFIKNINRRDKSVPWFEQLSEHGLDLSSTLAQHFVSLVHEILGFPRHLSQHVGGFVISSGPLHELVPVENAAMENRTVIQWDKEDLQTLGLLKVDVLALGMLSAVAKSFALLKQHYDHDYTIADITRFGDDPQVYHAISQADTVGVFQIESRAQMSMLPRLKPRCYYDLVIQIAIVRPGPIQGDMVHPYLKRRDGIEAISYPSAEVKSVLKRTLGVPIFQEQVIKLAMVAAGFSGGEADQLRRAMAKWQRNGLLTPFRNKLLSGMTERGYSKEFAERIFKQICGFGEYGFPESHSASFAVLAYVSAWLKYYYPEVFYCALLNSQPMGFYSPAQLIQDAKRHDVTVLGLDINQCQYDYTLEKQAQNQAKPHIKALRLGLRQIKGLSETAANAIIEHRPQSGFASLNDIKALGYEHGVITQRDLNALASSGALHAFGDNRYVLRWLMMDDLYDLPLFRQLAPKVTEPSVNNDYISQPSERDNLLEDYQSIGLSLEHHPIALLERHNQLSRYTQVQNLHTIEHQKPVTVIGVVTGRQAPGTAAGVTFITLEDHTGSSNVIVWQATASAQKQAFLTSRILKVQGILEREGDVCHIIAGKLTDLSHLLEQLNPKARHFH